MDGREEQTGGEGDAEKVVHEGLATEIFAEITRRDIRRDDSPRVFAEKSRARPSEVDELRCG
jgi:hypothetical protein